MDGRKLVNLTFQSERWPEIFDELQRLVPIQWREIALDQQEIPLDPDWQRYAEWDRTGNLAITTVRDNGVLAGWHISMIGLHPHYQTTLFGMQDLYYVLPEYRRFPTVGMRLFMAMEDAMRKHGVKEIIGNTKAHFDKSPLFERLGWRRTGIIYSKVLA